MIGLKLLSNLGIGIGLTLVVCIIVIVANVRNHEVALQKARSVDRNVAFELCGEQASANINFECVIEAVNAQREEQHVVANLRVQHELATSSWLMLIVTSSGIILIAYTLIATRDAVNAAIAANDSFARATEREYRPWLSAQSVRITKLRLQFEPNDRKDMVMVDLALSVENHGRSPALDVSFSVESWRVRNMPKVFAADEMIEAHLHSRKIGGVSIPPGESHGLPTTILAFELDDDVDKAIAFDMFFMTCVTYTAPERTQKYYTKQRFRIIRDQPIVDTGEYLSLFEVVDVGVAATVEANGSEMT